MESKAVADRGLFGITFVNVDDTVSREELIRSMLVMVRRAALRLKRMVPSLELDDLIGDGSIGLIRAVDSFDPERGPTLEHYARRLILGAMLNGVRRMDPVSERARRLARAGDRHRYDVAAGLGSVPSASETESLYPGYSVALRAVRHSTPLSLDMKLPDGEMLSCDWSSDPARIFETRAERTDLCSAIDALTPRHRSIVMQHYFAGQSLRSIGRRLHISPQRVSQLHRRAIELLARQSHAAAS
ncbi:MAG: sigma-70 family RNA polymerase sigma factor [Candidatus Eremiobacteraeota bacterium]|nr:sigma-70 family RNA polymerase sigma factor [Candidatus Eremiobacteraeota bacterium]